MMYPVNELFYAFQGEGIHMGKSAFFIRTHGCPVHCPWCDSAGTWHKDYVPKGVDRLDVEQILFEIGDTVPEFVVVTGGEPTIHDLGPLYDGLSDAGIPMHLETCGGFPLRGDADWVTISPKEDKLPLPDMLRMADEFKIIVDSPQAIDFWVGVIGVPTVPTWLHPEWSQRENPEILQKIATTVKEYGAPFRAGWQLHKLYQVDRLDGRTAPLAPLGGDPNLGY